MRKANRDGKAFASGWRVNRHLLEAPSPDVMPRKVRPALLAAFTRARRLGLSTEVDRKQAYGLRSKVPCIS